MKAIVIEAFGGTDALKIKDIPQPTPQEHEVMIQVAYAAVNPVDWKIREGLLKSRLPHQFPLIPGWDAAGKITAVGKNVRNFKVGDEVYAYCRKPVVKDGTYAEYICFDAAQVALKPKSMTFAQASSIPLAGLTAWQALFDFCNLKPKQSILIHAGSGGVGSLAIQFAKNAGAEVFTTCSEANADYVKRLGADHVIDYNKENFASVIKKIHKDGIDTVFDTVGGKTMQDSVAVIKKDGTLVSIVEVLSNAIGEKHQIKSGFLFVRPDGRQLAEIAHLIDAGKVQAPEIIELPLKDAAKAQQLSKEGHTRGKIVLKVKA